MSMSEWQVRHPSIAREFSLQHTEDKGRLLASNKDRRPGELLLRCAPYTFVLLEKYYQQRCHHCFVEKPKLLRCSKCKLVYYCSSECQKASWSLHKYECENTQRVAPHKPTPTMLLLCRLLWRARLEKEGKLPLDPDNTFDDVGFLNSHAHDNESKRIDFVPQAVITQKFLGEKIQLDVNHIVDYLFKFSCNNFNISDGEMRPIGIGLYPVAALINHSCAPNSVAVFEGTTVSIRALQHIPAGEEISISYIEIGAPTLQRRATLAKHFFFVCHCPRCETDTPFMSGYRCVNPSCAGVVLDSEGEKAETGSNGSVATDDKEPVQLKCNKCGKTHDKYELELKYRRAQQLIEDGEDARNKGDITTARKSIEQAVSIFVEILHQNNVELMNALNTAMSVCIDAQDFAAADKYCTTSIPAHEYIYPPAWPLLGLQYYMKGRIDWYFAKTQSAVHWLRKALAILEITHGYDHSLVKGLVDLLREAEAEMQHKANLR
jgi:SET and MYND domain-containing protein